MPLGRETGTQWKQRALLKINYAVNMTRVRYDALGWNEENNVAIVLSVNVLSMNKLGFFMTKREGKKTNRRRFLCFTQNSLMTVIYSFVYLFPFFAEGSEKSRPSCLLWSFWYVSSQETKRRALHYTHSPASELSSKADLMARRRKKIKSKGKGMNEWRT